MPPLVLQDNALDRRSEGDAIGGVDGTNRLSAEERPDFRLKPGHLGCQAREDDFIEAFHFQLCLLQSAGITLQASVARKEPSARYTAAM